ncbi:hypothetical protein FLAG1_11022 [Fusarium langsethiae]|uniref:Secreted peptide n=1 Tax=Fusarium langsethiae TaxID=179993 RepID=A0A0M9ENE9_FUSLA|nr:hypothetical protein FLAG1_11022 [Fusarium langsethiae]
MLCLLLAAAFLTNCCLPVEVPPLHNFSEVGLSPLLVIAFDAFRFFFFLCRPFFAITFFSLVIDLLEGSTASALSEVIDNVDCKFASGRC